ncbi:hypothetical protein V2V90_07875 [Agrobacterium leguminum]|uniref:hypothetical protein n=1 Tax=Agrobacterium leguminum TaxID=2792015 RepID=UPI0030CE87F6
MALTAKAINAGFDHIADFKDVRRRAMRNCYDFLARPNERRFNRAKYSYNQKRKIVGKAGWIYTIVACCTGHDQAAGMLPDLS